MDQLPHKINTEQSNRLEEILQQMDPSLLQGYKKFMHEVIIQGISYHGMFNTVCEKVISYYEMPVISGGANGVDLEAEKLARHWFEGQSSHSSLSSQKSLRSSLNASTIS